MSVAECVSASQITPLHQFEVPPTTQVKATPLAIDLNEGCISHSSQKQVVAETFFPANHMAKY